MISNPLASVCVVTYNHKDYIKQCLDGVLMQQTNFPYEIILGEDGSTDGTREICMEYAEKYPEIISLFLRSRKDVIYINGKPTGRYNMIECLKEARGKYIALCEGDDYWTDPLKLQKQVDFLESNSDSSFVSCGYYQLKSNKLFPVEIKQKKVTIESVFNKNIFNTASLVFRRRVISDLPDLIYKANAGDWFLQAWACKFGYGYAMDDYMAVYRIHQSSLWSSMDSKTMGLRGVNTLKLFKEVFKSKNEKKLIGEAIKARKKEFKLDWKSRLKAKIKFWIKKIKAL